MRVFWQKYETFAMPQTRKREAIAANLALLSGGSHVLKTHDGAPEYGPTEKDPACR